MSIFVVIMVDFDKHRRSETSRFVLGNLTGWEIVVAIIICGWQTIIICRMANYQGCMPGWEITKAISRETILDVKLPLSGLIFTIFVVFKIYCYDHR